MRVGLDLFTMADVVIFYGPPFVGKTAYCEENFNDYKRISAREVFLSDSSACLRQVILQVVNYLRDGQKVVIDDENWSDTTRSSYINTVKSKVPGCTFQCIMFHPKEKLQVYWSREWALAEQCMTQVNQSEACTIDMHQSDDKFDNWFSGNKSIIKTPQTSEGFTIKTIETHLTANTHFKFEVPALFVPWQSIVHYKDNKSSVVCGVSETFNLWYKVNPCGRIIIINDSQPESGSQDENMKTVLSQICNDLKDCVLYFCTIDDKYECGQFAVPPRPGLVAWLQRLHHLQLKHRGTLFLTLTSVDVKCAEVAGINHMTAQTIYSHPHLVTATHCAIKAHEPTVLQDMTFHRAKNSSMDKAKIPLFDICGESKCLKVHCGAGRVHGICYPDFETLQKYQDLYTENATPISETSSRVDKLRQQYAQQRSDQIVQIGGGEQSRRSLPKWLIPKSDRQSVLSGPRSETNIEDDGKRKTALDCGNESMQSPRKKLMRSISQSVTVYCMNELELVETAKMALKQFNAQEENLETPSSPKPLGKDHGRKHLIESHMTEDKSHVTKADSTHVSKVKEDTDNHVFKGHMTPTEPMNGGNETEERNECTTLLDEIFCNSKDSSNVAERSSKNVKSSQEKYANLTDEETSGRHSNLEENLVVADSLVPETVSCIQETVMTTASITSRKKNPGPDLTFLDDLF